MSSTLVTAAFIMTGKSLDREGLCFASPAVGGVATELEGSKLSPGRTSWSLVWSRRSSNTQSYNGGLGAPLPDKPCKLELCLHKGQLIVPRMHGKSLQEVYPSGTFVVQACRVQKFLCPNSSGADAGHLS